MSAGHPKVTCLVPGCPRYTTTLEPLPEGNVWLEHPEDQAHRWICGGHWRLVPRYMKRRRSELTKRWRAIRRKHGVSVYWELPPGSPPRLEMVRLERLIPKAWAAIERAGSSEIAGPEASRGTSGSSGFFENYFASGA